MKECHEHPLDEQRVAEDGFRDELVQGILGSKKRKELSVKNKCFGTRRASPVTKP